MGKELKIGELNKLYTEADQCDREIFAEQRSNILLIAGDHYNRKATKIYNRGREPSDVAETQRLRLTKNHLHKVYRHYVSNIISQSPGVSVLPNQDSDLQNQKQAELNRDVWEHAKYQYRFTEKTRNFAQDFIGIGEVACKVFFDPNKGEFKGYEAKAQMTEEGSASVDQDGNPVFEMDESGEMLSDQSKPMFKGAFVFERLFGFNLMRCPGAKSFQESPYIIVRKMVDVSELKGIYADDEDKLKMISETKDDTFIVFDQNRGEYTKTKDEVLVREFYWRACYDYPNGYWAITTQAGILAEGELPYGIFPIRWEGFDEYPTTPRGRSIIKQLRPFQAEINRAASQVAQHQVTLGDDKVIYQGGTKLAPGALLPGVRGITFNGVVAPQILPGRDGSQYLPYIESQIAELYEVAEMAEDGEDLPNGTDAFTMLFSSMRQQKKYAVYAEKFEQFLIDICELYLSLARYYLPDDEIIYSIGKGEMVNIAEFRKTSKLCYEIKIEPRNESIETQMGKQLTMNHILQYVGPNLQKDDIGKIIRNMPFGNYEESFDDLTIDYDLVKNDFLAMERGESPQVNPYDKHDYIVNKTSSRMKKPDFKLLSPQIKTAYLTYLKTHEKLMEEQAQKLIDAKNEFIPVSGSMIACDMYVPNPDDPSKAAKRVRIPYTALDWLVKHLEAQGSPLQKLESMNQGAVSDLASMVGSPSQQPTQRSSMSPSPMAQPGRQGPASPSLGVS